MTFSMVNAGAQFAARVLVGLNGEEQMACSHVKKDCVKSVHPVGASSSWEYTRLKEMLRTLRRDDAGLEYEAANDFAS